MENAKAQARVPATMAEKFKWLKLILRDRELSASAKNVATVLMTFHNDRTGQCNPAQSRLAEAVGLSRRGVNRLIAELKAGGWIVAEGTLGASSYRLLVDRAAEETETGERIEADTHPTSDLAHPYAKFDVGGTPNLAHPYAKSDVQNHPEKPQEETTQLRTAPADAAPAPVSPMAVNDNRPVGMGQTFEGWTIPAETIEGWTKGFTFIDVPAQLVSSAPWFARNVAECGRVRKLEKRLSTLNAEARKDNIGRKEAKAADAEAGIERCLYTGRDLTKMRAGEKTRFQW